LTGNRCRPLVKTICGGNIVGLVIVVIRQ